jgi:hypothetical protein
MMLIEVGGKVAMGTGEKSSQNGGNPVWFLGRRKGALENPAWGSRLCAGIHPVFHNQSSARFLDKTLQVLELPHHRPSFSTDPGVPMYKDNELI